jgi:hypothetical protein
MTKVQGAGVYAKGYAVGISSQALQEYATRSTILGQSYGQLKVYAAMAPVSGTVVTAPNDCTLLATSSVEAAVYLYNNRVPLQ